tara:strand:- start:47 stop:505 length:459 start_codon:yes stop_codon:yes gene_type:complete
MAVHAIAIVDSEGEIQHAYVPGATYPASGTEWDSDKTKTVVHITSGFSSLSGFMQSNYYKDGAWKGRDHPPADYYFWKDEKWNFDSTEFWIQVRRDRDMRLLESDWTQLPDCKLDISKQGEWTEYRQILRNVPGTNSGATMLNQIVWPDKPA